ncbi:hypothetical protein Afil01_58060 [Actinorhabdospora filicis]|uniref:MYXO-CTERM domain-containing protein n=1 Tax=Actinorhabdospora filicis TaxID=1785913 RepID=A0A9W6SQB2_9ACTN|nr:hypothetical protein [Actinorhabdospora filicis]GLZ80999.1 hypothetical protein Afil01_58060 [Actinorhabdospora filicis]
MKRRALFSSWALAALGLSAVLVPAALTQPGPPQAPPYVLVDDAGGGSQSPEPPLSPKPSAPASISPAPADRRPVDGGEDGGSGGGTGDLSFGTETALSLGLLAVAALLLIPGRRPPRSAASRTGR